MRITIPSLPYPEPVGAAMVALEYANRLAARGHRMVIAHGRAPAEILLPHGIVLPPESESPDFRWFSVDARVEQRWFDLFDLSTLPEADVLFNAPASGHDPKKGARVVFVHGFGMASRAIEDAEFLAPGGKVCVSRWVYDELRARGVPESELAYVPNGVDLDVFRPTRPNETRPNRVAMLHHFLPVKGTDVGLSALERVKAALPDTEAVLFGVTPRPDSLPTWIEYRHLPSRRQLADEVYNASAVVLCPSRGDSFYLCGLEGMASGCALASTDLPGVREYAMEGTNAVLSEVGNAHALAENVIDLLTNVGRRAQMARAGVERAQGFGWERSTDLLEGWLEGWAGRGRRVGTEGSSRRTPQGEP